MALGLSLIWISSCSVSGGLRAEVHGVVLDQLTKEPVRAANISGTGGWTVAGADGGFSLDGLSIGHNQITVKRAGYIAQTYDMYLEAGDHVEMNVYLQEDPDWDQNTDPLPWVEEPGEGGLLSSFEWNNGAKLSSILGVVGMAVALILFPSVFGLILGIMFVTVGLIFALLLGTGRVVTE